jgi:hypothetical protein
MGHGHGSSIVGVRAKKSENRGFYGLFLFYIQFYSDFHIGISSIFNGEAQVFGSIIASNNVEKNLLSKCMMNFKKSEHRNNYLQRMRET